MKKQAIKITSMTLIGPDRSVPAKWGNCFSVETSEGLQYRIVNFYYENLNVLIGRRKLQWPVDILTIGDNHAIIADDRIEVKWYRDNYCETCCPFEMLPLEQKAKKQAKIDSGEISISRFEIDGQEFIIEKRQFKSSIKPLKYLYTKVNESLL